MKFRDILVNFLICWICFGIPMAIIFCLMYGSQQNGLLIGCILGLLAGFLFALLITLFQITLFLRKHKLRDRYGIKGEALYDGAANHMIEGEAVGGWLFLMEDGLYFTPHRVNLAVMQCRVPYADIADVTKGKMLRTFTLQLQNGETETFLVNRYRDWIERIKERTDRQMTL